MRDFKPETVAAAGNDAESDDYSQDADQAEPIKSPLDLKKAINEHGSQELSAIKVVRQSDEDCERREEEEEAAE